MRKSFLAAAVAGAALACVLGARPVSTQAIQQCYYRAKIDPVDSCTICANTCLGGGARCCIIVSGT